MIPEAITAAAISLGTGIFQQHSKEAEFQRQQLEQSRLWQQSQSEDQRKWQNDQAAKQYQDKIDLLKQQCPPLAQLGPNPSEIVLKIYLQNCKPLNDYLEPPPSQESKP